MDHAEPMDIDSIDNDYENKENSILHSNVLPRTPCTEKGYEELDISELNMKLRYSITPASSPMSRSFTANSKDHKNVEDKNISVASDTCLTSSLNSTLTNNDSYKKVCPLQSLPTDQLNDTNRNVLVCRSLDNGNDNNITITISDNVDENFSIPSTSSSVLHSPEATTPTKELQKEGGSPIMRSLRSVLSIFRPSQSPIPPNEQSIQGNDGLVQSSSSNADNAQLHPIEVSTPLHKTYRSSPKRNSPLKDRMVFNDDLEKELQWKDESTILFKEDKIPKHKLLLQENVASNLESKLLCKSKEECNKTLEYMEISYNDSILNDKTMTDVESKTISNIEASALESDGEFVDCETTYSKVDEALNETKEILIESKANKSIAANHLNSVAPNSINVKNYSLNDGVSILSINTSHNKGDENNGILNTTVSKEMFIANNDINTCEINNTLKFKENENTALSLTNEAVATSDLCLTDKEQTPELNSNESIKSNQVNCSIQDSSMVEKNYSLNATLPIGSLDASHNKVEKDNAALNISANKEIYLVNNDINISESFCEGNSYSIKNDALTEDKSLSLSEVAVNCDLHHPDIIEKEQALLKSAFTSIEIDTNFKDKELKPNEKNIDIHNNILNHNITDKKEFKDMQITQTSDNTPVENDNTAAICVNVEKRESEVVTLQSTKVDVDSYVKLIDNTVDIKDILNLDGTKVEESFTKVIDPIVEKGKPDEIKDFTTLSENKVETNYIVSIHDGLVDNAKEAYYSNSTSQVLNKPDQHDLNPQVIDSVICSNNIHTHTTFISNISHNSTVTNEDTQVEILHGDTNKLQGIQSNVTLDNNQETNESIIYNENQFFRTSIDTEIPKLKFIANGIQTNEINKFNLHGNTSHPKLVNLSATEYCQENVSKIDNIEVVASDLENNSCTYKNSNKINDLEMTYVQDNCVDTINSFKKKVQLPAYIPLPSDSEAEENNIECNLKTDSENSMKEKSPSEKKSILFNSTPIDTDSVLVDQISKVNETHFRSLVETELKDENKATMSECYKFQSEELNQCGATTRNLIDDVNQDNKEIATDNEQLTSLSNINNSEVNVHMQMTMSKDIPLENSNINNLGSDMKEDLSNTALKEVANPFETKMILDVSPPLSPLLIKKGYDINFDIDDPFATKTKIRQSPPPESPSNILTSPVQDNKSVKNVNKPKRNTPKNKGRGQQLRKSGNTKNNALNTTYVNNLSSNDIENSDTKIEHLKTSTPISDDLPTRESTSFNKVVTGDENRSEPIKMKCINVSLDFTEPCVKDMTKSVFNCPEINDVNFHSVSDLQKETLPHSQIINTDLSSDHKEDPKTDSQMLKTDGVESVQSEVKHENKPTPISNETFLSRNTDSDITREINTEDEDTATFIEMEELIEHENLENLNQEKQMADLQIPDTATDSENIDNGELFIDAEAFEFLLNQNQSNIIAESGKESLFLKFDPLFAKRVSSDGIIAALKKVQNKQSTPKKITKLQLDEVLNIAGPSKLETTFDDGSDDGTVHAMSKPMMVVNPAVNPIVSPRKVITPKINRQSLTFTSPAMAVIDRLLSLSGNHSDVDQNTSLSTRQPSETDLAITQLREMLADKDIHVHNLRSESKDLKDRLCSLEAQVKTLETESADRLRKINDLSETLVEKTKINKSMATVVEEYEKTIASLITQMEQEKKSNAEERIMLIKERDEQTAHLASMEVSFSDLHSKYEKSKQIIYSMKSNEDTLRKSITEFEESLVKMQSNYELLKQHATSKLNHANQELEKYNRAHEAEILKLNALIKRKELHITSLEETLAQKTKANEELTAICDELINKVG